ncbi:MAG TPA: hypothetical protein EYP04_00265 [Anaerolineae bacterium]|nr:hypothetical protein [Anaerolineae bacterium]HIQ04867.1 hypothetical protein [Anaerolineae bacterium]
MKLLTFQAKCFWWKSFAKTLESAPDQDVEAEVRDAVVVFLQAEARDVENRSSVFRKALKHIKWLANKRGFRNVVLHSFTHLGGVNAEPEFAREFIDSLAERLRQTDYQVWCTPFGYFCEWELSVYGESIAKVWKEI